MHSNGIKWRRRLIRAGLLLLVPIAISTYLAFTRLHFSTQTIWPLSQLQWNRQTAVDFNDQQTQIIGHRGSGIDALDRRTVIGNTHHAIDRGIEAGVDWIEIDVRLSGGQDPVLMAFHDERIDEKTTGRGAVSDLSVAELQDFDVKVPQQARILTLDEVLEAFHERNENWVFDVKAKGIHRQVLSWLDEKSKDGKLSKDRVIIFGTEEVLKDFKEAGSDYSLGYIVTWGSYQNRWNILLRQSAIIERCQSLECDYLVLPVIFASRHLVDAARAKEINVWVYGVVDKRDFNQLAEFGVRGFILDDPTLFD